MMFWGLPANLFPVPPQVFMRRSTIYIPTVFVGAYFSNEVRLWDGGGGVARRPTLVHLGLTVHGCAPRGVCDVADRAPNGCVCVLPCLVPQAIDYALGSVWRSHNKGVGRPGRGGLPRRRGRTDTRDGCCTGRALRRCLVVPGQPSRTHTLSR